jgi:NAD(P)-dependent dehydrogenase (short-subunit alcohol dehydrogenase family)
MKSYSLQAYAVTKAGQVHLMRCLAKSQGPKVKSVHHMKLSNIIRVNAVLPGLLLSECIPVLELY